MEVLIEDVVVEDMWKIGVTNEDARDRVKCWQMIHCDDP